MLITSPSTSSRILPLATAATAMTLSRLITRSAIRMVLIAPIRCSLDLTSPSPSSSGTSSFTAIQKSRAPPMSLRKESFSISTATMVRMIRNTTAAAAPHSIASFCWRCGRERAARAITTALSPDRMMFTQIIPPRPSQNCAVINSCIEPLPPYAVPRSEKSEQAYDLPVNQIDLNRRGHLGQAGHGHDVPADHHDELGARREAHLAYVEDVVRGRRAQLRIRRERVLRLRDAYRVMAVAVLLQLLDLAAHLGVGRDLARAVDLLSDLVDLVPEGILLFVDELEIALLLAQIDDDARQLRRALAPVAPVRGEHHLGAELLDSRLEQLELLRRVVVEAVDRNNAGNAVVLLHVLDVALEVGDPLLQRLEVLLRDRLQVRAAVVLHRAHRGDDHRRRRAQPRLAALDVDELLRPQVGAEARFGDHVVGELHRGLGRDHGVAAMGDVRERAAMDERRVVLERLDEVGLDRVLQQHRHRAVRLEILRENRFLLARVADDDLAQALLQVLERVGQAEDRHDLGGDDDIEPVLARVAVAGAAEAHGDVAQRAVVHVDDALPGDAAHVDAELVAVVDVVVDHRREQVVRERDRVEVAGKVQVDVFHRNDLRVAPAGRAALHAEHRPERRLAQADHRLLADVVQRVAETDRRGGLALARGRGADRGDQDQLRVGLLLQAVEVLERNLRLVVPVGFEVFLWNTELGQRDLRDAFEFGFLCDFDIRGHRLAPSAAGQHRV